MSGLRPNLEGGGKTKKGLYGYCDVFSWAPVQFLALDGVHSYQVAGGMGPR